MSSWPLVKQSRATFSNFLHPVVLLFDLHILPCFPLVEPGCNISVHLKPALCKDYILRPPSHLQLLLISPVLKIMTATSDAGPQMPLWTAVLQHLSMKKYSCTTLLQSASWEETPAAATSTVDRQTLRRFNMRHVRTWRKKVRRDISPRVQPQDFTR